MIRRNLRLKAHTYIVDLYKSGIDIEVESKDTYIMLRKFGISNNLAIDTDVYFINKEDFAYCLENDILAEDADGSSKILAFPVTYEYGNSYSDNIYKFNSNYDKELFENGDDIYHLFNMNGEPIKIPSDIVRIYHPDTTTGLNAIIHLENYINDINFHYFCRPYNSLEIKVGNEFYENKTYYSEYVEFKIPNIESLFNARFKYKYNYYTNEIIHSTFIEPYFSESQNGDIICKDIYNALIDRIISPYPFELNIPGLNTNIAKFIIENADKDKLAMYSENLYKYLASQEWPITVTEEKDLNGDIIDINVQEVKSYEIIHNSNNVYFEDDLNVINKTYNERRKVLNKILSKKYNKKVYEYVDEQVEVLTDQVLPLHTLIQPYFVEETKPNEFDNINTNYRIFFKKFTHIRKSIENNYLTYPININIYSYSEVNNSLKLYIADNTSGYNSSTFYTDCKFELCSKLGFDKNGICSIINEFNYPYKELYEKHGPKLLANDDNYDNVLYPVQRAWCAYNCVTRSEYTQIIADEWDTEYPEGEKIKLIGYYIEIASDIKFKNIIYRFNIEQDFIDDFAFNLTGIFNSWENLQEIIVARVRFIDKYLGIVLDSNFIVITKEWFKYIINDTNTYKCHSLKQYQKNLKENNMNISEGINFIDKITCVIKKSDENTSLDTIQNTGIANNSMPKILYKPIFYKVQSSNSISLRQNVTQNIGINLGQYLTKVETFKISICNKLYVEIARNDMFVIFNINASEITDATGTYDILDTDNEYITSGTWNKY